MDKRGWIQIVEASISMMILFGLVLGLFQQRIEVPNIGVQVYKIQHQILTEASEDYCIRNEVLANSTESLNKFITSRLCTLPYSFTTVLCSPTESCLFPDPPIKKPTTDIYSDNLIIAANLTEFNPVKIAFFVWQGSTPCETYECNITSQSGEEPEPECTESWTCKNAATVTHTYSNCQSIDESATPCPEQRGVCSGSTKCSTGTWQDCTSANYQENSRKFGAMNAITYTSGLEAPNLCGDNLDNNCNGYCDTIPTAQCTLGKEPGC